MLQIIKNYMLAFNLGLSIIAMVKPSIIKLDVLNVKLCNFNIDNFVDFKQSLSLLRFNLIAL